MAEKKDADVKEKESLEKGKEEVQLSISAGNKTELAYKITHRYTLWSMGAGLIPIPWLDVGALAGVQLKMVHNLAEHYQIPFSQELGRSIITALVGTISADYLRRSTFNSLIKSIPIIGFIGSISMPIYSGAISYAIGRIFVQHFESGGTLLTFDPQKVKDYFKKLFKEGQKVVAGYKDEKVKS
jgi:uncharacterized protein (DUF697 family)